MPLIETESLILKSYNLSEADRIIVLFTREQGLIRGVAKGARRLKSKFGSSLEPFSIVNAAYFQKEDRELVSIQNVELIRSSFPVASIPAYLQTFSYFADLLQAFMPLNDPSETLYRMVKACVETDLSDVGDMVSVRLYFEIWLLRLTGYLPDWTKCRGCSRTLNDIETVNADIDENVYCGSCFHGKNADNLQPFERSIVDSALHLHPRDFASSMNERNVDLAVLSSRMTRSIRRVVGDGWSSLRSQTVKL